MPETKPPASEPEKSGWFDRLLDLGNHNKIIAAATLVTLATGVPYLAVSAWSALTGEEEMSMDDLLNMRLTDALAQVQVQAMAASAEGTESTARTQQAQEGALITVAASARGGATPKEQNEVMEALLSFGKGDSGPALTQLAAIARAQEGRGDLDAAAETWCKRGHLQVFADAEAALADFERADDLSETGIDAFSQLERGRLLRYSGRFDDALNAYRVAARAAEREGDDYSLCVTLGALGKMKGTSWDDSPDFLAERHSANVRCVELAARLRQDPVFAQDRELLGMLGSAALVAGGGLGAMRPGGVAEETADSARIAELLRGELESLQENTQLAQDDRNYGLCAVAGALGYALEALGAEALDIAEAYALAVDAGQQMLDAPSLSVRNGALQMPLQAAGNWAVVNGYTELAVGAYGANRGILGAIYANQSGDAMASGPGPSMIMAGMAALHGRALVANGDRDAGMEALEEVKRLAQAGEDLAEGNIMIVAARWQMLNFIGLYGDDDEWARRHFEEADALFEERLVGSPLEAEAYRQLDPETSAARVRLGFSVGE